MDLKQKIGKQLKDRRQEKGLLQKDVSKVLGYKNDSYVSDAERGKFIPQPEKLKKWAKALGMTQKEMNELVVEAKLDDIGLNDPGFTIMFKEVPNMTAEEKESVIRAYEAVIKARGAKRKSKS